MTMNWAAASAQPSVEDRLPPIGRHISPRVLTYEDGRLLLVIRVTGTPFEAVQLRQVGNQFEALSRMFTSLAADKGNRLSLTTTVMRRQLSVNHPYTFPAGFAARFADRYMERFSQHEYFENDFYLSALLKVDDIKDGLIEMEDLGELLMKALQVYDPECLRTYEHEGCLYSQVYEFLGELINGVWQPMPVSEHSARESIPGAWLSWGYDTLEVRAGAQRLFATAYDLSVFPPCKAGMTDGMLSLPASFTLTQTFLCAGSFEAIDRITKQANKLASVGDKALHERDQLEQAQGHIQSRELSFGEYHGALVVWGSTADRARTLGEYVRAQALGACQMRWVRATRSARFTYMSQLPGAKVKPRPMFKSTRNLAAAFSMHTYSSGKARGNPLGDGSAVMPLQTVARGLYNFNFHASRQDQDNTGEMVAGHTVILGATGTGKTALQTALLTFLDRFDVGIFALDVDCGMEIWLQALGGRYFALQAGEPTGLAPFELPDTPLNREFLYELVGTLAREVDAQGHARLSAADVVRIKDAVDAVFGIEDVRQRTLSRLLESIPEEGEDGLHARLSIWCRSTGGRYAWALDNMPAGRFDLATHRRVGFDVTAFMKKDYPPAEPVIAYLLHLKDQMKARVPLLATVVEEFWLPLQYPFTQAMMLKVLKTGRKLGEFLVLVSQSPEEAIASPIWPAIRDQSATRAFLANPNAEWENYRRCNLTEREFEELRKLSTASRTFLIKQGNQSAFAVMDLHGMDDELAILSGTSSNLSLWRALYRRAAEVAAPGKALDVEGVELRFHDLRRQRAALSTRSA